MRVAVVGAGIGGLSVAVGLQRAGAEVVVYERSSVPPAGGSALSVFPNGIRAIDEIGLGEEFRAITVDTAETFQRGIRRPDGSWLVTQPAAASADFRTIHRTQMHRMLSSALAPQTVHVGHTVTDVSGDGTVTSATDGTVRRDSFDLVVAADGIRSTVRARWPEDPGVAYSGYSVWRGITADPIDLRGEAGETWGTRRRIGILPLPNGHAYWFAVLNVRKKRSISSSREHLESLFADWHPAVLDVIRATPADQLLFHPVESLGGNLPSFVSDRVVLLGDAAHAMTPDLGQGGAQALEDAATLTALLRSVVKARPAEPATLTTALRRYDNLRVSRTQAIAARSRAVGRLAHTPGRFTSGIRNLLVKATPERTVRRQLAWLSEWQPPQ